MSLLFHHPLDDFFAPPQHTPSSGIHHRASCNNPHNIFETEKSLQLSIDVPGIKVNDLSVKVDDNVLRVSGERKTTGRECTFERSFALDPKTVDANLIKANLDSGVLTLTVPKRSKPAVCKTITVTQTPTLNGQ